MITSDARHLIEARTAILAQTQSQQRSEHLQFGPDVDDSLDREQEKSERKNRSRWDAHIVLDKSRHMRCSSLVHGLQQTLLFSPAPCRLSANAAQSPWDLASDAPLGKDCSQLTEPVCGRRLPAAL